MRQFLNHVCFLCRDLPGCCQQCHFVSNVSCPSGHQSSLVIVDSNASALLFSHYMLGMFLSELSLITAENVSDSRVKASGWFSDWHKQEWSNDLKQHECEEISVLALFDARLAFANIKNRKTRQTKKRPSGSQNRSEILPYLYTHTRTHSIGLGNK